MSRLAIETHGQAQTVLSCLYRDMGRRIIASQPGLCPVDMSLNFLRLCHAQTCGKCVPCRIGLGQLAVLIEQVLDRTATLETVDLIERTAKVIADSADCAIGFEAANMVLLGIRGFREDYEEHILHGRCFCGLSHPVPCVSPAPPTWTFQAMWPWSGRGGTRTRCASSVKITPSPPCAPMCASTPARPSVGGGWWMTA